MKRLAFRGMRTSLVLVCLIPLVASQAVLADEPTFRDLARRYFASGDGTQLTKVVGLPKEVKHVVALDYTVLLLRDGGEKAVDPKDYEFKLGGQFHCNSTDGRG